MNAKELQQISGRNIPESLTPAAIALAGESLRLGQFLEHIHRLRAFALGNLNEFRTHFFKSLSETPAGRHVLANYAEEAFRVNIDSTHHEGLVAEMVLQRTVDNFLKYISDLLAIIFKERPQSLKTSEQEKLDFVLSFSTMEELIHALAEKRVEKLSFLGMDDLSDYFEEKLGFTLFPSQEQRNEAVRLVETRNIIVHNRGCVSRIFKRRVQDYPKNEGEHIELTYDEAFDARLRLENMAFDIDRRAAEKWNLSTLPPKKQQG